MMKINEYQINRKTKKGWQNLLQQAVKSWNINDYLYIYQKGSGDERINYHNFLRVVRSKEKPKFRPISQARWWLDHRLNCYKKGIRFPIEVAINYE